MPLKAGDTFFMGGTGGEKDRAGAHLVVCLVPKTLKGNALVVPIVSMHPYSDTSCVLQVTDHPWLKKPSCASYDWIKCVSTVATDRQIAEGGIQLQEVVAADVLIRLQVGLVKSDEAPGWAVKEAEACGLHTYLKNNGHIK